MCVYECAKAHLFNGTILCLSLTSVTTVPVPLNVVSCMAEANHYACGHSDSFKRGNDGGYCSSMKRGSLSKLPIQVTKLKIALVIDTLSTYFSLDQESNACQDTRAFNSSGVFKKIITSLVEVFVNK